MPKCFLEYGLSKPACSQCSVVHFEHHVAESEHAISYEQYASLSTLHLGTPLGVRVNTCAGEQMGDQAYPDGVFTRN